MKRDIAHLTFEDLDGRPLDIAYRIGTRESGSDLDAIQEVIERRCYRRAKIGFDVEQGEHWLDLGANIGAFAMYCRLRGATATSFEPDPECFTLLKKNTPRSWSKFNAAVSASTKRKLQFYSSPNPDNRYRGTVADQPPARYVLEREVENTWAGDLAGPWSPKTFDGIKMDIEGAEGPIIDKELLPPCKKLVMEYHTSRDPSAENLLRRLGILRNYFNYVKYPKIYDGMIMERKPAPRYDQLIFCWGPK